MIGIFGHQDHVVPVVGGAAVLVAAAAQPPVLGVGIGPGFYGDPVPRVGGVVPVTVNVGLRARGVLMVPENLDHGGGHAAAHGVVRVVFIPGSGIRVRLGGRVEVVHSLTVHVALAPFAFHQGRHAYVRHNQPPAVGVRVRAGRFGLCIFGFRESLPFGNGPGGKLLPFGRRPREGNPFPGCSNRELLQRPDRLHALAAPLQIVAHQHGERAARAVIVGAPG